MLGDVTFYIDLFQLIKALVGKPKDVQVPDKILLMLP